MNDNLIDTFNFIKIVIKMVNININKYFYVQLSEVLFLKNMITHLKKILNLTDILKVMADSS